MAQLAHPERPEDVFQCGPLEADHRMLARPSAVAVLWFRFKRDMETSMCVLPPGYFPWRAISITEAVVRTLRAPNSRNPTDVAQVYFDASAFIGWPQYRVPEKGRAAAIGAWGGRPAAAHRLG